MLSDAIKNFVSKNNSENIAIILKDASVITGNRLRESLISSDLNLWHLERDNGISQIINGDEIVSIVPIA